MAEHASYGRTYTRALDDAALRSVLRRLTGPIRVLVLNGSLKHRPEPSNTEELANDVLKEMSRFTPVKSTVVRLADLNIPHGVEAKLGDKDDWPKLSKQLLDADIVIFATPIWWASRSSLIQKVLERMDDFDEQYIKSGRNLLYGKVAGVVVTGIEDGAMNAVANLLGVLIWFGFTIPPEAATYWVGEVGKSSPDPKKEAEKRRSNEATKQMTRRMARNLLFLCAVLRLSGMSQAGEG